MKKEISLTEARDFINATDKDQIVEMTNPRFNATMALQEKEEQVDAVVVIQLKHEQEQLQEEHYYKFELKHSFLEQFV